MSLSAALWGIVEAAVSFAGLLADAEGEGTDEEEEDGEGSANVLELPRARCRLVRLVCAIVGDEARWMRRRVWL